MELVATSVDGFLAYWCGLHEVRGEIHSVFQNALNIKTSGGQLISILSRSRQDGPNTVVTDLPRGMDFITLGLRTGMPVRLGERQVDLGEGAVCLHMERAQRWWPRLAGGLDRLDLDRLDRNLQNLREMISHMDDQPGLGRLLPRAQDMAAGRWEWLEEEGLEDLSRRAVRGIQHLLEGTLQRDERRLQKGLDDLLGLGTGLTPSGDDLLLGFLGTLRVVSRRVGGPELESLLETISPQIVQMRQKTTFVSGNLLSYACAGRLSATILAVIRALLFEDPALVRQKTSLLLQHGATSGAEILFGILLALSLLPRLSGS